jgi:hypothetical protein
MVLRAVLEEQINVSDENGGGGAATLPWHVLGPQMAVSYMPSMVQGTR